jgi:AcrR family transcriptional regulator
MNHVSYSGPAKKLTQRGQKTRAQLLEAAEMVFGEAGYEHASISEITKRAGVALGTFYIYFPHKQAVFTQLVDELGSRLRAALAAKVRGASNRIEMERAGFKAFFEFASKHHNLYRIVRQAEFVDLEVYHRYYRSLAAAYAKGLSRAMEQGEIGDFDPEVMAYVLMGIADMLGMRFVMWESPEHLDRVVDEVMEFVGHGLLSQQRLQKPGKQK